MSTYADAYQTYLNAEWKSPLPLPAGKKTPPPDGYTGWQGLDPSGADLHAWTEEPCYAGTSQLCLRMRADVIGIDVDHYGVKRGGDTLHEAERRWGPLPAAPMSSARGEGVSGIRFFSVDPGTHLRTVIRFAAQGIEGQPGYVPALGHIEIIQRHHRYAVAWPSVHPDTGGQYLWYFTAGPDQPPGVKYLKPLPEAWIEALRGSDEPGVAEADPATVQAFLREHRGERFGANIKGVVAVFLRDVNEGMARHDAITRAACMAAREARAGFYPAGEAFRQLREAFLPVMAQARAGQRLVAPGAARAEFGSVWAWAVSQALAESDESRAEREERRVSAGRGAFGTGYTGVVAPPVAPAPLPGASAARSEGGAGGVNGSNGHAPLGTMVATTTLQVVSPALNGNGAHSTVGPHSTASDLAFCETQEAGTHSDGSSSEVTESSNGFWEEQGESATEGDSSTSEGAPALPEQVSEAEAKAWSDAIEEQLALNAEVTKLRRRRQAEQVIAAENRQPLRAMWLNEFLDAPQPDYLIPGMFVRDGTAKMFGPPGGTKSFLALDAGLCVATGRPFFGDAVAQGVVHYVMAEGHATNTSRALAWFHDRKADRTEAKGTFRAIPQGVLLNEQGIAAYLELVRADQPVLVFLDTKNRMMVGEENSASDVAVMVRAMDAIREAVDGPCCVVLIDHTGLIDQTRGRGSNAVTAAMDTEIRVDRDEEGLATAEVTRDKAAVEGRSWRYRLHQVVDVPGIRPGTPTPAVVRPLDIEDAAASPWSARDVPWWASEVTFPGDLARDRTEAGRVAQDMFRAMRYMREDEEGVSQAVINKALRQAPGRSDPVEATARRARNLLADAGALMAISRGKYALTKEHRETRTDAPSRSTTDSSELRLE